MSDGVLAVQHVLRICLVSWASQASPKSSKVAKAPSKKATYSSSSNKAAKNQSANSGKNVSFAHLDRTASGDEDNQLDDSEDGQYVPANSSKKRGHEDMETEPGARRNVPLRRSVSLSRMHESIFGF